ncbi:metal-sulfur cluster assembly factor [Agrobacterium sp. a22-2]|uniref:metal-sulfur cluster assembly factor n=1 Tax=Agrobacterium sp. a22-2 TaxID=2283840 RepID=UPI0014465741|nr:metal-sulfur cluster assembly factor [Agrobacterium sp. a22-2]NKN35300.1 metal-sulfur cluster assembly factor [Agrobacterium sp. a22-2]
MSDGLQAAVRDALRSIIDPEIGGNIVDLGLIYDVQVLPDDVVHVSMTTTVKGCPAAGFLKDAVQACAGGVPGVRQVDVALTYDPPWTPDRITETVSA